MKNPLIHILTILVGLQVPNAASGATTYQGDVPIPTFSEVSYGPHGRNVLDFWQARSDQPTPLVLIIHGGGWTQGSKECAHRPRLLGHP